MIRTVSRSQSMFLLLYTSIRHVHTSAVISVNRGYTTEYGILTDATALELTPTERAVFNQVAAQRGLTSVNH